jgi:hypothetical protein
MKLLYGLPDVFGPVSFLNPKEWTDHVSEPRKLDFPWDWAEYWDYHRSEDKRKTLKAMPGRPTVEKYPVHWKASPCRRIFLSPSANAPEQEHTKAELLRRFKMLANAAGIRRPVRLLFAYDRNRMANRDDLGFGFDKMLERLNTQLFCQMVFMITTKKFMNLVERAYPDDFLDLQMLLVERNDPIHGYPRLVRTG